VRGHVRKYRDCLEETGAQQVGRPTVAQCVRGDAFADTGAACGLAARDPDSFVRNRLIEFPATSACGEQVQPRLPPAPLLSQGL